MVELKLSHKILIIIALLFGLSKLTKLKFPDRKSVPTCRMPRAKTVAPAPRRVISVPDPVPRVIERVQYVPVETPRPVVDWPADLPRGIIPSSAPIVESAPLTGEDDTLTIRSSAFDRYYSQY